MDASSGQAGDAGDTGETEGEGWDRPDQSETALDLPLAAGSGRSSSVALSHGSGGGGESSGGGEERGAGEPGDGCAKHLGRGFGNGIK